MTVVLARIANAYGPGQRLDKGQGLISQICRAQVTGQPLPVFVDLETQRDYLFVDDLGAMIVRCLELGVRRPSGETIVKILASGRPVTVGHLLAETRRVLHRPVRTFMVPGRTQVLDLRLSSVVWPEVNALSATTLPSGLAATAADIHQQVALGRPLVGRRD